MKEYVWVVYEWIPHWQSDQLCVREVNWWIYTICLDCVSGGNPQWLQRSCPCLHQLWASLVHVICSWINADVSIIQSLQSFRLLLLNNTSSPQVWIWQHCMLSEKRHRFFEPVEKCSCILTGQEVFQGRKNKEVKRRMYGTQNIEIWQNNVCTWNFEPRTPAFCQNAQVTATPTALAS